MNEHPILFSGEMVRAILEGRKTQTRRVVPESIINKYGDYDDWCNSVMPSDIPCTRDYEKKFYLDRFRYGGVGHQLWVRETFSPYLYCQGCWYWADGNEALHDATKPKPSIFMPRWASRIQLEIVGVRVERVQEITNTGAEAEGIGPNCKHAPGTYACTDCMNSGWAYPPIDDYQNLWDSINKKRGFGWDVNPWVWVVEFKVIRTGAQL